MVTNIGIVTMFNNDFINSFLNHNMCNNDHIRSPLLKNVNIAQFTKLKVVFIQLHFQNNII